MLRPNYAHDAPPTAITVGGVSYAIKTDYRVWLDVLRRIRDLITKPQNAEHVLHNCEVMADIEMLVFGKTIKHPAEEVLNAINDFAMGYPSAPVGEGKNPNMQTYSFEYDLNYIILAIRNQSGIDLSYRRKEPFHWWEFLLEFHALCGDHYILRLMEIRGYDGKDRDMQRQAQRFALPRENTADDQLMLDEFDALFPGA